MARCSPGEAQGRVPAFSTSSSARSAGRPAQHLLITVTLAQKNDLSVSRMRKLQTIIYEDKQTRRNSGPYLWMQKGRCAEKRMRLWDGGAVGIPRGRENLGVRTVKSLMASVDSGARGWRKSNAVTQTQRPVGGAAAAPFGLWPSPGGLRSRNSSGVLSPRTVAAHVLCDTAQVKSTHV